MACKLSYWFIITSCILLGTTNSQIYLPEPIEYDAFPYSNRTFLIYFKSLATYADARTICRKQGGRLAKIDSSQYNTLLTNQVYIHTKQYWMNGISSYHSMSAGIYSFWSGTRWHNSKKSYVYHNNQVARYANWLTAFGEPSSNGNCVEIFLDDGIFMDSTKPYQNDNNNIPIIGHWSTTKCTNQVRPFVCERFKAPRYKSRSAITLEPSSVIKGNKTYLFFVQNVNNITNAMNTCKEHNATTVNIESDDEFWFIGNYTHSLVVDYWRGGIANVNVPLPFNTFWYGVVAYNDKYNRKWVYNNSRQVTYLYGVDSTETNVQHANQDWSWSNSDFLCISANLYQSTSLNYYKNNRYYWHPSFGCDIKLPFVCERPFTTINTHNTSVIYQSSSFNMTLSLIEELFHSNRSANYTIVTNSTFTETINHYQVHPKDTRTHTHKGVNVSNAILLWVLIGIGCIVLLICVCMSFQGYYTIVQWRKNRDHQDVSQV